MLSQTKAPHRVSVAREDVDPNKVQYFQQHWSALHYETNIFSATVYMYRWHTANGLDMNQIRILNRLMYFHHFHFSTPLSEISRVVSWLITFRRAGVCSARYFWLKKYRTREFFCITPKFILYFLFLMPSATNRPASSLILIKCWLKQYWELQMFIVSESFINFCQSLSPGSPRNQRPTGTTWNQF